MSQQKLEKVIRVFLNPEIGTNLNKPASSCNIILEGNRAYYGTSTKSASFGHWQAEVVILSIRQH